MAIAIVAAVSACAPPIRSTLPGPPNADQLAELWIEPDAPRSLYFGVGGEGLAPDPAARYRVLETVEHVRWLCERMNRLTDEQWVDTFRAGGYTKPLYDRHLRRLREKTQEGLALREKA